MAQHCPIDIEKPSPVSLSTSSSRNSLPLTNDDDGHKSHTQHQPPSLPTHENLTIVSFEPNDPANPYNWSTTTKTLILVTATLSCINTSFSSTLPSNLVPPLPESFGVPAAGPDSVLPASLYLAGFVFGPLLFAPLSEAPRVGRWWVLATGAAAFVLLSVAAATVRSWPGFLAVRFALGVVGSPPVSVFGGVLGDVYEGEVGRGRVLMIWSAATFIGPLAAPILAGYTSPTMGWRFVFWIGVVVAALSLGAVLLLPETLASTILVKKAARLNKENHGKCKRFVAPSDLCRESLWETCTTSLMRPWRLLFREMIVSLTCVYLGFVYAVFYMLVQIFPAIFRGVYGFSPGISGILFSVMGFGTFIGCFICWWCDDFTLRLSAKHPNKREEYLRLPLACAAGPMFVVSMLWLGWSARPDVHWLVPLMATIPYGLAYHLIFVVMINYVADAYGVYSASALAALSMTRSVAGTLIPLAVEDMLAALGIAWSCTVLAAISAALALVPFGFIAYGEKIRAASRFSATLKPEAEQERGALARMTSLSVV
ncbi:Polyamine transporter 4 [Madurella fahalii]|uniref:Polyamine transporter 4 n=1 Tax=Madurella fahalii TaxID=1157608 RepID=A0ABQ0GAQ5_9PEZI